MRTRWLALILFAACGDSPTDPPGVEPQCEVGHPSLGIPTASAELVESTSTFQRLRLVCRFNGTESVEYRYRVHRVVGDSTVVESETQWADFDGPTIRVDRHATQQRILIWDVRSGTAMSTSLWLVHPQSP